MSVNSSSETGSIQSERSFDAWGRLRNPTNWSYTSVPAMSLTNRGFTGHEHIRMGISPPLEGLGEVINMNGRVYDPVVARFLSADDKNIIPISTQHFNRYSYVLNNPLKYIDPSGWNVDDFVFNEEGNFVRREENKQQDRVVVENSETLEKTFYELNDPANDSRQLRAGNIKRVEIFKRNETSNRDDVASLLQRQGAFSSEGNNVISFALKSLGKGDYDYSYGPLSKYEGASSDPVQDDPISSVMFLIEGEYSAYNQCDMGLFLWGATGFSTGLGYTELQLGAEIYSRYISSFDSSYEPQPDTFEDQRAITKGAYHAEKLNYRKLVK